MPKVKLDPIPVHIIIPDTNILWDKDKKNPVSPIFDQFWSKNLQFIPMELVIPEVVFGELQFQQATSAIKLASSIKEQMTELSGISQTQYSYLFDDEKIKKQVGNKLHKWVKNLAGRIEETPIEKIDWSKMIQNAIWRYQPFTFDPKEPRNEKGFRDALILETLINICNENNDSQKNIVFICNDYLLRDTAEKRLNNNDKAIIFESIEDFESYIKLTQEKLTNKFVKSIQNHARKKFFTKNDNLSVCYRDDILKTIIKQFSEDISLPGSNSELGSGLLGLSLKSNWLMTDEKWWIGTTRFKELVAPREYHWVSRVTLARLLAASEVGNTLLSSFAPTEKLQVLNFDVNWQANVKADGRFHDISVESIEKTEATENYPTEELLLRWGLSRLKESENLKS